VQPFKLLGVSKAIAGVLVAVVGVGAVSGTNAPAVVWLPVVLGIGLASAGVLVSFPTILQLETPPNMMGRVYATASAIPTALQMIAPVLCAAVATAIGVGWVLVGAGSALAVVGAAVFAWGPPIHRPDAPPVPKLGLGIGAAEPDVVAHLWVSRPHE